MAQSEPIRDIKDIERIEQHFINKGQIRNYVLFVMGIYVPLRISDLLSLKWGYIYNFETDTFYSHLYIIENKTRKNRRIALNKNVITALKIYMSKLSNISADTYLFLNNRKKANPICREQAWKIIKDVAKKLAIRGIISPHSMRKVIGHHLYKNGMSISIISKEVYEHSSEQVTKKYLMIEQAEIDDIFLSQNYRSKKERR